ncbi:MAG: BTAD domain-containing putative transcriptional regulator [Chloroflexota bacterium]
MTQRKLHLFGTPELVVDQKHISISLRKAQALLAYVAVTNRAHSRDSLATLFWPEANQRSARTNLRRMIYSIGQQAETTLLDTTSETVGLSSEANIWVDVVAFKELATQGLHTPMQMEQLLAAEALYQKDFMAGFKLDQCPEFSEWQFFQREELRRLLGQVLVGLMDMYRQRGEYKEALPYARRWLVLDSLHEAAHRRLIELYALAGQQAAAIRQFEECVRILGKELGVQPEKETTELFQAVQARRLTQDEHPKDEQTTSWKEELIRNEPSPQHSSPSPTPAAVPASPQPGLASRPHSIPLQTTAFIGREDELADIMRRLADPSCKLLTLIGPGGIGKTRLSIEVGKRILDASASDFSVSDTQRTEPNAFANGVYFVPLQPVKMAQNIPATIANALGLHLYENRSGNEQLLEFLATKAMLLVLDNFEHLFDGMDLILDILRTAPAIKILVTSRNALPIREAWFHPVTGMYFPKGDLGNSQSTATVQGTRPGSARGVPTELRSTDYDRDNQLEAGDYDAVRLFERCAQRTQKNFSLAKSQEQVMHICRLVEGMPLAIELAAAWLRILSVQEVVDELERSLDILTAQHQNVPDRHSSVRAVFLQSWGQLDQRGQDVLMRLALFRGSFDKEAAEQVANATILTLVSLVDHALLQRISSNRYQLHELLRQFAAEQLSSIDADDGETMQASHSGKKIRRTFCDYFLRLVHSTEVNLRGEAPEETLNRLSLDIDNIRQAWQWASDARLSSSLLHALTGLSRFYEFSGLFREGASLFAQSAERLEAKSGCSIGVESGHPNLAAICCRLRIEQASMLFAQGLLEQAGAVAKNALAKVTSQETALQETALQENLSSNVSDDSQHPFILTLEGRARFELGRSLHKQGKQSAAPSHYERALQLATLIEDTYLEADVLRYWCWNCYDSGDFTRAVDLQAAASARYRQLGDRLGQGVTRFDSAYIAWLQGDLLNARSNFALALADFRRINERRFACFSIWNLALIDHLEGKYSAGLERLHEARSLTQANQDRHSEAQLLIAIAGILTTIGTYEEARHYLDQSEELNRGLKDQILTAEWSVGMAHLYHQEGKNTEALALAQKGLQLAQEAEKLELVAEVFLLIGTIQSALSEHTSAKQAFEEAYIMLVNAKNEQRAVEPLAGLAKIHHKIGEREQAMANVESMLKTIYKEGAVELSIPDVYLTCFGILHDNEDQRAQPLLSMGQQRLQKAAALIEDQVQRRSFLERVPINRKLNQIGCGHIENPIS